MVEACDDPDDVGNIYPVPTKHDCGPCESNGCRELSIEENGAEKGLNG